MSNDPSIYRLLQRHLDKQAVGFPATPLGSDKRFLMRMFTPEEAKVALHLSYKPAPLGQIIPKTAPEFSAAQTESLLDSMFRKGAIGWKEKSRIGHWFLVPIVVGIYENAQRGTPYPGFFDDAEAYLKSLPFAKAFIHTKPSQMRTIPINKSISISHPVATYNQIREIVQNAPGPFVAVKCICREKMTRKGKTCQKTSRQETCLSINSLGAMVLRRGHGREVNREEALESLRQSEAEGLVLQPSNAKQPEFICSCCGCCCGMLLYQKFLPNPVDFWTSDYQVAVDLYACKQCGKCVSRCQVNAVTMAGPDGKATVNVSRCIGCGLCVPTCPSKAMRLEKKTQGIPVPKNDEELYDEIMKNKKGAWGQWMTFFKVALKTKPWARKF